MDPQLVVDALTRIVTGILSFVPSVFNGLIVLLVGYAVAAVVRWLVGAVLRRLGIDVLSERIGILGGLRGLGIRIPPSLLIARTAFGLLLLAFTITATRLMRLEAVAVLLEGLLNFLPSIIAGLIVFLLGSAAARLGGNWVSLIAVGAGLGYARQLGRLVQYIITLFAAILALGVLGIQIGLLVTAVTIMIAAFGLAIGIGLGLGARSIVYHILAGYYVRQRYRPGQAIRMGEMNGEVGGTSSVNTVVITDEGATVVPNGALLESMVQTQPSPSPKARKSEGQ